MKICFPVKRDEGAESSLCNHFGSAPMFVVFDDDTKTFAAIDNAGRKHAHGTCSPIGALDGQRVDCVVANVMGDRALAKLSEAGITVYRAMTDKVRENIDLFSTVGLPLFRPELVCARHMDSCINH